MGALVLLNLLSFLEEKTVLVIFRLFNTLRRLKFLDLVIFIDWMRVMFLSILFIIAGAVGMFSLVYMSGDIKKSRFFFILNLFIFSMILLILMPHYVCFFIGWDGLGFTSFLLIKYYKSSNA
jgi:NADH:ubiquinone oxidoreductase subunit 5 (subunit L)/multisubunit Na+/H+ antiporter MnhA subunit